MSIRSINDKTFSKIKNILDYDYDINTDDLKTTFLSF